MLLYVCVHGNNRLSVCIIIMPPVLGILIVWTISNIFVRVLYSYGNLAKSGTKCQVPSHKSHALDDFDERPLSFFLSLSLVGANIKIFNFSSVSTHIYISMIFFLFMYALICVCECKWCHVHVVVGDTFSCNK